VDHTTNITPSQSSDEHLHTTLTTTDILTHQQQKIKILLWLTLKNQHTTHTQNKKAQIRIGKKTNKSKSAGRTTARPLPEEMGLQISSNSKIKTPINDARYAKISKEHNDTKQCKNKQNIN